MRAIWSGEIAFGLVAIPAKLYSATKDLTPQFNQLHKECGTRINMIRRCPKCEKDLAWEEIGKGYEVSKGQYALFTKEELAKIEGDEGASGIDISEFVDPKEVDMAYLEKTYWVGPAGKSSRSYNLLHAVLATTGRVALAKVRIRSRTRLGMLRPRGNLFALDMMRFAEEMVSFDEADLATPDLGKQPTEREFELAKGLVAQLSGPFDPKKHPDAYRAAVLAAVDEKVAQGGLASDAGPGDREVASGGKVIDLAELLARSLQGAAPANASKETKEEKPASVRPSPAKAEPREEKPAAADEKPKKTRKRAAG